MILIVVVPFVNIYKNNFLYESQNEAFKRHMVNSNDLHFEKELCGRMLSARSYAWYKKHTEYPLKRHTLIGHPETLYGIIRDLKRKNGIQEHLEHVQD